eukprot:CAMPEP_0119107750 /NCGR_PEP_ID=MMETSP1180-20130426/11581_1 /TAXON_ID=3052 ORGANISM="Chlamydomonas cf sp, Strain CCMP681" /NCGR_SAMPLE_ID=MMETSP1180 /ASSEMBLY_ACC=CAM_ASM_000741 /LENGTH=241 /DNA_ID=CAMNT_0007093287 /DNA_START=30 /DNA_END=755 /DNA_ORIENTATION=+
MAMRSCTVRPGLTAQPMAHARPVDVRRQAARPIVTARAFSSESSTSSPSFTQRLASGCGCVALALTLAGSADARLEGVNRPDLLPKTENVSVIDVAGFITPSEEARITAEIASLERDTGFKLRVLAQNYPETPGSAVKNYWKVDDSTIVFVADPTFKNIINVNVGQNVDLDVPRSFWSRLAGTYGNAFYLKENGEAEAILNAVSAIDTCLREPQGRTKCASVQKTFGEKPSSGAFGKVFGQ